MADANLLEGGKRDNVDGQLGRIREHNGGAVVTQTTFHDWAVVHRCTTANQKIPRFQSTKQTPA